jgi:hypothetical protein
MLDLALHGGIDHGEPDQTGIGPDPGQRHFEIAPGANEDRKVSRGLRLVLERRQGGTGQRVQRLAGRIGDQMKVEFAAAGHGFFLERFSVLTVSGRTLTPYVRNFQVAKGTRLARNCSSALLGPIPNREHGANLPGKEALNQGARVFFGRRLWKTRGRVAAGRDIVQAPVHIA